MAWVWPRDVDPVEEIDQPAAVDGAAGPVAPSPQAGIRPHSGGSLHGRNRASELRRHGRTDGAQHDGKPRIELRQHTTHAAAVAEVGHAC